MMKFSVIIPTYKCSRSLQELSKRIISTLEQLSKDFEIIFVNDASPENDWEVITNLTNSDNRIKGLNFSRNFGQHHAITAGLDYAKGDWIIVMDGDLQDQPEDIINLYKKSQEGYDIVFGIRKKRKDKRFKRIRAKLFFKLFDIIVGTETDSRVNTFSICSKKVVNYFLKMREQTRSYTLFLRWLGFPKAYVTVTHNKRIDGNSSYSIAKLVKLAIDYLIIYSNKPLRYAVYMGLLTTFLSIIGILFLLFRYFTHSISIQGWTSMIAVVTLFSGIIISFLGIIGLYIGKIYDETKKRPIYVIQNTSGI